MKRISFPDRLHPDRGCSIVLIHTFDESSAQLVEAIEQAKWSAIVVAEQMPLVGGHVYVIPPHQGVEVIHGMLRVAPIPQGHLPTPIDQVVANADRQVVYSWGNLSDCMAIPLVSDQNNIDKIAPYGSESRYVEPTAAHGAAAIVAQLERELKATRSDLQRSLQDMEAANEELKSSNEELLSMHEALQAANQALELPTEEIQAGVDALSQLNNDLENLLRSTQIATIFLDEKLRVRSFNPAATEIYGLIASDIGRPLSQLRPQSETMPSLPARSEVAKYGVVEHTFRTESGKALLRRVLPYQAAHGEFAGLVVTFTDVTEMERTRRDLEISERQLHMLMDAVPAMIAYVDRDCRYQFVNYAYCAEFNCQREDLIGLSVEELLGPEHYPQVAGKLARVMSGERVHYEYVWNREAGRAARYKDVNYVPDIAEDGTVLGCYVLIIDITERKQQSLQLADREQQLESLISSTAEGIYGVDTRGMCTFANKASAGLLGFTSAEDLLGREMHTLIHHKHADGTHRPPNECLMLKAIEQQRAIHVDDEVFWRADGSMFDVEYWSYPQYRDGEVIGCVVTFLDVTERRRWGRELADRESHLRRVIDNMLGFVGILDLEGTLLEANTSAIQVAGVEREELIGKRFWDCFWFNHNPETMLQIQHAVHQAAAGDVQRFDVEIQIANNARMMLDFQLVPVMDASGSVTYLIPSGIDISDRLRADAAYRHSAQAIRDNEERLAMALRAGGMAAWEWNPQGCIWTREMFDLLDISPEQIASPETFFECVYSADRPAVEQAWKLAVQQGLSYEQEFRIQCTDGSLRWIGGVGKVIRDDAGEVVNVFGLNWDSTKTHLAAESLRESERRAQEANLAKSQFIANMSHEIRTPMTAVLGYTDLLLAKEQEHEKAEHLRTIKRNGKFLLEIINDILDLSKIEAGKLEIDRHEFAPQEVFDDVQAMMKVRAGERNLKFCLGYTTPMPATIRSDAKRLKQILVNLVGNAIKFTERGSVNVWVSFDAAAHRLRFDVVDTGIGISTEQQVNLFHPFSQGDASVTRKFGGTGLGLAISLRLAKMLGGEISVKSQLLAGSTFACAIDTGTEAAVELVQASETIVQSPDTPAASPFQLQCRILVVDDRRDVRHLTRHFLVRAGAQVEVAENGQQALDIVSERWESDAEPFDLILLDMQMPRLDGYEAARALRQMGFRKPIIALTADAMQGDMSRCIESGCDSYLSKPIDGPALLRAVAEHLAK